MNRSITRRDLLRGIGHAAAFGTLAAALPRFVASQEAGIQGDTRQANICLSMIYLNTAAKQVKFDADRWRDGHLPMLKNVYGDSIERAELRVAFRGKSGKAEPSALAAAVGLWIRDNAEFSKRSAASSAQIMTDLGQITDGQPVVQFDRALVLQGDPRDSVTVGSSCLSIYFPNRDGARFDSRYYTVTYLPRLSSAFGYKAVRRIEIVEGAAQGAAKPAVISTTHLYVRDQREFDQARQRTAAELMLDEAPNYTDIRSVSGLMTVYAAG